MLPLLIYIASPYTQGDAGCNVLRQILAGHEVMDLGHCPVIPNLGHYMALVRARPYEDWMARDFALIKRCDLLWRLPGESPGADREESLALSLGLPVVYARSELISYLRDKELGLLRVKVRL